MNWRRAQTEFVDEIERMGATMASTGHGAAEVLRAYDQAETERVFGNARAKQDALRLINNPRAEMLTLEVQKDGPGHGPIFTIRLAVPDAH